MASMPKQKFPMLTEPLFSFEFIRYPLTAVEGPAVPLARGHAAFHKKRRERNCLICLRKTVAMPGS